MKKYLGIITILALLGLIVAVSGCTSSEKSSSQQLADAKALVKQVESANKTLTAEEQKAYEQAKQFIQQMEQLEAQGKARGDAAEEAGNKAASEIINNN